MKEILYDFSGYNKKLFISLNQATNYGYIPVILQKLGTILQLSNFIFYYFALLAFLFLKIKSSPFSHKKIKYEHYADIMCRIGLCYTIYGFVFALCKFSINLPRPYCSLNISEYVTIIDISKERCLSAFPSSHTGLGILILYFLTHYIKYRFITIVAIVCFALITVSRITLAMHYPADIFYGSLIATLVIWLSNKIYTKYQTYFKFTFLYLYDKLFIRLLQ